MAMRRLLFASDGISVVDFCCREHDRREGPEEPNETHSIALVRRGVFQRTERGRQLVADANHVLFFNATQGYRYAHPVAGGDDLTILTIATPLALELVAAQTPRDADRDEMPFPVGYGLSSQRTRRLHYELLDASRRGLSDLAMEDALAELASEALRDAYATHDRTSERESLTATVKRRRRELTEAVKVILNRKLATPPSLQALARHLGCSPFHLSHVFHATAGLSMRRYLGVLRAGVAADHLARGAPDLTELALTLGYTDHSHFTNSFRKEFGVAPSVFRRRFRNAGVPPAE